MRRTAMTLSAVALAATLGACSQGSPPSQPGAQPQQGALKPAATVAQLVSHSEDSMRDKQTVIMDVNISGGPVPPGAGQLHCQVDLGQGSQSCDGPVKLVLTKQGMFLQNPQLAKMAGDPSTPWVKVPTDPNSPLDTMLGQAPQQMQRMTNINTMLPQGTAIQSSGPDQVDGQPAVRYQTVTDLKQAGEHADPALKPIYQDLSQAGLTQIQQTIWTDPSGLPMQATTTTPPMTTQFPGQQGTPGRTPPMTITARYHDWGKPVTINTPPSTQVQDMKLPQLPGMPK